MTGKSFDFMAFLRYDSEDEEHPDVVSLRYETAMPWSVMLLHPSGIRQYLSRDLLHKGLDELVGSDEVADHRTVLVSPDGVHRIEIRVFHNDDFLNIMFDRTELAAALSEMAIMVPQGRESEHLNWTASVARCQKATGL